MHQRARTANGYHIKCHAGALFDQAQTALWREFPGQALLQLAAGCGLVEDGGFFVLAFDETALVSDAPARSARRRCRLLVHEALGCD